MQSTATVGLDGSENVGNWPSFTAAGVLQTFCVASKIATTRLNISVPPGKSPAQGMGPLCLLEPGYRFASTADRHDAPFLTLEQGEHP